MLSVQSGAQPLLLAERLRAMVPEHQLKSSGGGKKTGGTDKADRMDEAA
jgi:chemotaxis protein MotA